MRQEVDSDNDGQQKTINGKTPLKGIQKETSLSKAANEWP